MHDSGFKEERWQHTRSLRIGYRQVGNGPTIVLLHGIGSGAGSWASLTALLAGHGRLVAWDAPGYGDSEELATPEPTAAHYAAALHDLLEALKLEPFYLVGHSLGAMMAAAYAAHYPERVRGVLLADPAQGYGWAEPAERERIRCERVTRLAELGASSYARQRAGALLRSEPEPEALEIVRTSMRRLRLKGFSQANWMLANDDIWRYLPAWHGPLHIACGEADSITPLTDAMTLAQRMNAPCTPLPRAGHVSYIDAPEAFARLVLDLIQTSDNSVPYKQERA
ncbi:alpha/beta fold hydrolase [Dyella caseinilytica]|uniref:Alpha/beta hydrolase n=1 Tax=Dyella caseinilytica TaxID=1849581 RepID=A0ABX7GRV6_9GAMM|nr:alpha/beta hydrolase [Dyella caseinilytica]QRN53168.1 alpha/beta hydrolase [Dyella caseinilytica]GGA11987.1 hydrolase [Dyella caseinilytica]